MPGPRLSFEDAEMNTTLSVHFIGREHGLMMERDFHQLQMNRLGMRCDTVFWKCGGGRSDCLCPGWSGKLHGSGDTELWRRDS